MKNVKLFINGNWVDSKSGSIDKIINPTNESVVGTVQNATPEDAVTALKAATKAQQNWKNTPAKTRADILRAFTSEIRKNGTQLAKLITLEQGKLLTVAHFEVEVTCTFIEYACEWARHIEGDIVESDNPNEQIWINKIPRGVVVAITAWNFPLALAGRKIGPALVAGNTMVMKPTPQAPLSTMALCDLAKKAGLPDGVLNMITGDVEVGKALVESPLTKMVTMTGSTPTGQAIFKSAAQNLTHVQLELGGKAPCIVFEDADIDQAVAGALHSRFDNCGQVCTCNERMYVHEKIYARFMKKFLKAVKNLKMGDPMNENSDIGPLTTDSGVEHLESLITDSVAKGAKITIGGKRPRGKLYSKGYWFQPTILEDVKQNMPIVHEELFGPVLPVIKFKTINQVIKYANDSQYGLAAMVFTKDMSNIMRLTRDLEFGEIYINRGHGEQHQGFHNGLKLSGTGGEDGKYGFDQYLEKKTSYIKF